MLKRCLDIILACLGCVLLLPFLPLLALLIKWDSQGPVFYRCARVGKDGKIFHMYKFRTMYEVSLPVWASVAPEDDPRITPFGRFLRRTKINEFPQLLNILKGEMTFVGPRPEAPDLAAAYPPHAQPIFSVTPGLVGPNQIMGRNEEEWYPPGVDAQQYYIEEILPKKLPLDLAYVRQPSLSKDVQYILLGIKETLFKAISWKLVLQSQSQLCLLAADCVLSVASFGLAHLLRFTTPASGEELGSLFSVLPFMLLVRLVCFFHFGLYRTLIRYISSTDIWNVVKAISVSSLLFISLTFFFGFRSFSRAVLVFDWLLLLGLMSALRLGLLRFREWQVRRRQMVEPEKRRIFIFGAGTTGARAFRFLHVSQEACEVIGFLDDDPAKRHKTLYGRKVLGNRFNLEALVQLYQPHEVLVALQNAAPHDIAAIVQACQRAAVKCDFFPKLPDGRRAQLAETLLKTHDVPLSSPALSGVLQGKRVLVAGTSGSLGLELCRQILRFDPERLVLVERSEPALTALVAQLQQTFPAACITPLLCPPKGDAHVAEIFATYRPHLVVQNALRKYLPFFPFQTDSIVRANYLATFALAKQAASHHCSHFVLVSSEEAHNRGNLIAESLRAVEISLRHFFATTPTRLVTVRLGDILENRGGIVTSMEEQIMNREPIVLPHRAAKCVLLSKRAAGHLILEALGLTESLALHDGIFVCPPSAAVPLVNVACQLATLHGCELGTDIPLDFLEESAAETRPGTGAQVAVCAIPTDNPGISLLKEAPLPPSQTIGSAAQALLDIQEHDLAYTRWQRSTRVLLEEAASVV
ncbi:MAG: sugar transferase [Candidatus Tectimicrobiota bacterium]